MLIALLKQQGVGIKGMNKSTPTNEAVPPLLEGGGKMEVYLIINFVFTSGKYLICLGW